MGSSRRGQIDEDLDTNRGRAIVPRRHGTCAAGHRFSPYHAGNRADLVVHLIACRDRLPQQRTHFRVAPDVGTARYRATVYDFCSAPCRDITLL